MKSVVIILAFFLAIVQSKNIDSKVIGGANAEDGQFPYQVSIRVRGNHNCGGSIIAKKFILTAGHCLNRQPTEYLTVVVGTNLLSSGGTVYELETYMIHEKWFPSSRVNDLGIIKLKEEITYNDKVQPIALEVNFIEGAEDLVLSGWGKTSSGQPDELQFIPLKSITNNACQEAYGLTIYESEICTYTKKGEGACSSDAGGPLVNKDNLVGVVSWGMECAIGYPDVYMRVSEFVEWIQDTMNDLK